MVILALIYLAVIYYLAAWLKRHFALSTALQSIRLMFFAPMLLLLGIDTLHRQLPRDFIFAVDYAVALLGFFSVCWMVFALAGDLVEWGARRFQPGFSLGRTVCYSLMVFAGVALYAAHRMFAPVLANEMHKEALYHLQNGNWNAAIKHYDTAILLSPGNGVYYYNRGLAYLHKGETDKALEDASKAIKRSAAVRSGACMFRAGINLRQRKYKEAIADYTNALSSGECVEAYLYRGYARFQDKDYENAIKDSSEYIRSAPDSPDGYEIRGLAYRSRHAASKSPLDPKDAQAATLDILRACDLGDKNACDVLNTPNETGFNYAAYAATSLPVLLESYKNGVNSMQAELAKAAVLPPDKRDIVMLDSAPKKIGFVADYSGKVRAIPRNKLEFIVSSAKTRGQQQFASLYKEEVAIISDGSALWMPMQSNLVAALKKEFKTSDKVYFYAVVIGAIGDEAVPLATEFKTFRLEGTPLLENVDKVDQYLLGPGSEARFPAATNRAAIVTAE